jgi:type II secretory pathway component PulF
MSTVGFWITLTILFAIIIMYKFLSAILKFTWAVLIWNGRLVDNPLFNNSIMRFDLSKVYEDSSRKK